jgi:hypothetical protein
MRTGRQTLRGVGLTAAVWLLASPGPVTNQTSGASVREASVRARMGLLASDALRGRGSGTREELIAATYVASEFRQMGLQPVFGTGEYVQAVPSSRPTLRSRPVLTAGDRTFMHGYDMAVQAFTEGPVAGPLVGYVRGDTVAAGSVVLMDDEEPPRPTDVRSAAAVLTPIRSSPPFEAGFADIPAPSGLPRGRPWRVTLGIAAAEILRALEPGSPIRIEAATAPGSTWNVLAKLPGRDAGRAGEVVLLGAHLDHVPPGGPGVDVIFNGADDNASGLTAVLEIAEALAHGGRPRRTVVFAAFGSEEIGGDGIRHFVDHPPVPLESIVADLQFEMIGRPDPKLPPRTLWLTGFDRSTLGPMLAARGAPLVADPYPDQGFFSRSDNIWLARRGVVAHGISSYGLHEDFHTPADEIAKIDFAHMTHAIQSLVEPIRWLANSSFRPRWREGRQPPPRPDAP